MGRLQVEEPKRVQRYAGYNLFVELMNPLEVRDNNNMLASPSLEILTSVFTVDYFCLVLYFKKEILSSSSCLVIKIGWVAFEQKSKDFREKRESL